MDNFAFIEEFKNKYGISSFETPSAFSSEEADEESYFEWEGGSHEE